MHIGNCAQIPLIFFLSIPLICNCLIMFHRLPATELHLELPGKWIYLEEVYGEAKFKLRIHVCTCTLLYSPYSATSTRENLIYSAKFLRGNL